MSEPSVTERRLRPIQDAVAVGNWKQAFRECEKWSKKGEKSDKFLALRAFVLVQQQDKGQHDKGVTETLQLCRRVPAVTDLDALHQLQDALHGLSLQQEEGHKLWDRAVAARPTDKDLLMTWLNQSVVESNWLSAQKAAMALRKAFSGDRQHEFWNILMCYLIAQDKTLMDKDRNLFRMLAYRMISKAVDSVPSGNEPVPEKAVSTPEELYLLSEIYADSGHEGELVEILLGDSLGIRSKMYRQDPQFFLEILLPMLKKVQDPEKVVSICHNLLTTDASEDLDYWNDDRIWNLLELMKSKTDSQSQVTTVTRMYIEELIGCRTQDEYNAIHGRVKATEDQSRTAKLVRLRHLSSSNTQNDTQEELLRACYDYFRIFGSKSNCFEDMRGIVDVLDGNSLFTFQEQLPTLSQGTAQDLFKLKLRYVKTSRKDGVQDLVSLATDALGKYNDEATPSRNKPEIALLAGLSLLRSAAKTKKYETALQALMIFHSCLKADEAYYPFLVVLTQLQSFLGLLPLSMESFGKLSVKNMQWETVGHLILTRIATLHPFPTDKQKEMHNPLQWLESGLTMLDKADRTLVKNITEGLKYGTYSNVINSVNMRWETDHSLNGLIFTIEQRKLARLANITMDLTVPSELAELVDRRDMSFLPNYSSADTALWAHFSCGPLPRESWVTAMWLHENILSYLGSDVHQSPDANDEAGLEASLKAVQESRPSFRTALTAAETRCLECHELLADAILAQAKPSSADGQDKLDTTAAKIIDWIRGLTTLFSEQGHGVIKIDGIEIPDWECLHNSFASLETLQTICLFATTVAKQSKSSKTKAPQLIKEHATKLQELAAQAQDAIHKHAKAIKANLNEAGVLGKLVDVLLGRKEDASEQEIAMAEQLEKLCDEVEAETLCGKMREAWEDALDGVLAVKIKQENKTGK